MGYTSDAFLRRQIPVTIRNLATDESTRTVVFEPTQTMLDIERDFDFIVSLLSDNWGVDAEFSRDGWFVDMRTSYEDEGAIIFAANEDGVYFWLKKEKKSRLWPFAKKELVIDYKSVDSEDYEPLNPFVQKEVGKIFFKFWDILKKRTEKGVYFFKKYSDVLDGGYILSTLSTKLVTEVFNNYYHTYRQGFWTEDNQAQVCFCAVGSSDGDNEQNMGKLKIAVKTSAKPFDVKRYWYEVDSANTSKTVRLEFQSSQEQEVECRYADKTRVYMWDWELYAEAVEVYEQAKISIEKEIKKYAEDKSHYVFDKLGIGEEKEDNAIIKRCRPYLDTIKTKEEAISILSSMVAASQVDIFELLLVKHLMQNNSFWSRGVWKHEGYMFFSFEKSEDGYLDVGVGWQHETQVVHPFTKATNLRIMVCRYDKQNGAVSFRFEEDMVDARVYGIEDTDLRHIKAAIAGYQMLAKTMLEAESRRLLPQYDQNIAVKPKKQKFIKPFERVSVSGIDFKVLGRDEASRYLQDLKHPAEGYGLYDVYANEDENGFYLLADDNAVTDKLVLSSSGDDNEDFGDLTVLGYIFEKRLTVTKSVLCEDRDYSPPMICLGGAKIKNGFFAGDVHYFGGGLDIEFCYGVYNHGSLIVKNGMSVELLIFDDFDGYVDNFDEIGAVVLTAATLSTEYEYEDASGNSRKVWNLIPPSFDLQDVLPDGFLIEDARYGFMIRDDGYDGKCEYKDKETTFFEHLIAGGDMLDSDKATKLDEETVKKFHLLFDEIVHTNRGLEIGETIYKKDSSDLYNYFFIKNESDESIGAWCARGEVCIFITRDREHNLKMHTGFYDEGAYEISKFGFFGELEGRDLFSMAIKKVFRRGVKLYMS